MAALLNATTGITGDVDDLTDTTPQPGSADSLSDVVDSASIVSKTDWTSFPFLADGTQLSDNSSGGATETWGVLAA